MEGESLFSQIEAMRVVRKQRQQELQELNSVQFSALEWLAETMFQGRRAQRELRDRVRMDWDTLHILIARARMRIAEYRAKTLSNCNDESDEHTIQVLEGVTAPTKSTQEQDGGMTVTKLEFLEQQLAALKVALEQERANKNSTPTPAKQNTIESSYSTSECAGTDTLSNSAPRASIGTAQVTVQAQPRAQRPNMAAIVADAHKSVKLRTAGTKSGAPKFSRAQMRSSNQDNSLEGILRRSLQTRFANARDSVASNFSPASSVFSDSDSVWASPELQTNVRLSSQSISRRRTSKRSLSIQSSARRSLLATTEMQPSQATDSPLSSKPVMKQNHLLNSIRSFDRNKLGNEKKQEKKEVAESTAPGTKPNLFSALKSFDKQKLRSTSKSPANSSIKKASKPALSSSVKQNVAINSSSNNMLAQLQKVQLRKTGKRPILEAQQSDENTPSS